MRKKPPFMTISKNKSTTIGYDINTFKENVGIHQYNPGTTHDSDLIGIE